jgi:ribosome-binding protein aMBF1 (putative translation factor)
MECSICGISGEKARLLDALSSEGIIKICEACSRAEDMPVLRRPTTFQLKESEKVPRYYERYPFGEQKKKEEKSKELEKTETTLREIIDREYERKVPSEKEPMPDLVENFHWIIMRARRAKKLTQEQLAKEISESEAAIKMAEQGILPDNYHRFVKKLESFLGVKLFKEDVSRVFEETHAERTPSDRAPAQILKFDKDTLKDLTISDLKKMKEEREESFEFQPAFDDIEELPKEKSEKENTEEKLTKEESNEEENAEEFGKRRRPEF